MALERVDPVIAPAGGGPNVPAPAPTGRASVSTSQGTSRASAPSAAVPAATTSVSGSDSGAVRSAAGVSTASLGGGIARAPLGRSGLPAAAPAVVNDIPSPLPAGSVQATQEPASVSQPSPRRYTVQRSDTLFSIAFMHDVDYLRLALANNLTPPYTIYPGQELLITEGSIDDQAVASMPSVPPAPAGEMAGDTIGERAVAAAEGRRSETASVRDVDGISWSWPASGRVVSNFAGTRNRGVDITGSAGDPVYAVADGDVVYAGRGIQGTGNLVILRHSARHLSAYMHNRAVSVSEGERVLSGDRIAEMGPGPSGEVSLHFEIRVDGQPVDPTRYLPSRP